MTFMEIAKICQLNGFNSFNEYNVEKLIRQLTNENKNIIYKMLDSVIDLDALEEDAVYILNREDNKKMVEFFRYNFILQYIDLDQYEGRGI